MQEHIKLDGIRRDVHAEPTATHVCLERSSMHPQQTWRSIITSIAHKTRMIGDDEHEARQFTKAC